MTLIKEQDLPDEALLQKYATDPDAYTDCFTRDVKQDVDLATYVSAFYTTWLFKVERFILRVAARRPSTDGQARDVAEGHVPAFAAWTVEGRNNRQLLMCDMGGHTRSWFMVAPEGDKTRLYFGSAVTKADSPFVKALMPFHKWYSRALLKAVKL